MNPSIQLEVRYVICHIFYFGAHKMTLASLFWFIVPPLFFVAAAVVYYMMTGPKNDT
ncbi:MAG: hypothetical protein GWN86_15630, partial [Desulfobacterales bacterium]|nr:hypothetical protein [Desulfobacterales bacterium]